MAWEVEEFELEEEGMVIFDGGSFSRGPFSLGARLRVHAGHATQACEAYISGLTRST